MTPRTHRRSWFWLVALCVPMLGACEGDAVGGGRGAPAGSGCGSANLTQRCSCDDGAVGAQTCDGASWSACQCGTAMPTAAAGGSGGTGGTSVAGTGGVGGNPALPADAGTPSGGSAQLDIPSGITFDWNPKVPFPDGTCEPGDYVGLFDGLYASPAAFMLPIPVAGDWNMTLSQSTDGENFEVSDGLLSGTANGQYPFSADIVGTLDCSTLSFSGTLENGTYEVGGTMYFFAGPITASYNRRTHAFEMGTWMVEEPPLDPNFPPLWPAGGSGTWNAVLQP